VLPLSSFKTQFKKIKPSEDNQLNLKSILISDKLLCKTGEYMNVSFERDVERGTTMFLWEGPWTHPETANRVNKIAMHSFTVLRGTILTMGALLFLISAVLFKDGDEKGAAAMLGASLICGIGYFVLRGLEKMMKIQLPSQTFVSLGL
jgi:hypothetical protein